MPLSFAPNPMTAWFDMASAMSASFFNAPAAAASDPKAMTEIHSGYCLYVSPHAAAPGAPMVVMLHGAGQDPQDFATGTAMNAAADRHGFVVLYPGQRTRDNPQQCWNWFNAAHQSRLHGEPARITSLVRKVAQDLDVDTNRIYVAGLSAGGAMAALLGKLFPDVYAAVGVHSGLAALAGTDLSSGLAAMRGKERVPDAPSGMPTIVFHGDKDVVVHPINGAQVMQASFGLAAAQSIRQDAGHEGRSFTRQRYVGSDNAVCGEHWLLHGAGHAWSGGCASGSFADPLGPDASEKMLCFFEPHRRLVPGL
jgi:poly(hydroxyalkanoate) depolymerase family esterase